MILVQQWGLDFISLIVQRKYKNYPHLLVEVQQFGVDFLSEGAPGKNFVENFFKGIRGVRFYVGKSVKISDIIVPVKVEKHAAILDIGSIHIIKDTNILDYWKDESIPSGARLYYKYYYKKEDKNGQHKNEKK